MAYYVTQRLHTVTQRHRSGVLIKIKKLYQRLDKLNVTISHSSLDPATIDLTGKDLMCK